MPGVPAPGEAAVMTTTTSVPETLSPGTYRIDEERCLITFRTRHLFGLGAVRGAFRLRSGEIRLAEQVQDSAVRATVDAESFHTGNPGRDRTVRSARLLDTAEHPIFTFTSTQVAESGGRWVVRGRLVVRDAEHPVELVIEQARADGPQLTIVASAGHRPVRLRGHGHEGPRRQAAVLPARDRRDEEGEGGGGTMTAIEVEGLSKRYGPKVAVDDVSFAVAEGEIFGLLGRNGAGKSTTVDCLAGLRVPDHGRIRVAGLDPRQDRRELRQLLGVQLQESELPDRLTVAEAMRLYASFYPTARRTSTALLAQLDLTDKSNTRYRRLSGGQKQRLSIALALIGRPRIAILDELTTGLDPVARRDTW